ncbi:UDP-2,3-diacylglucosamine hydrolase [Gammaproteobacteria bacterium]
MPSLALSHSVTGPIDTSNRFRSLWISDLHLGVRTCHASPLLEFLAHTEAEYLYLVGDILDLWSLSGDWYWPDAHNQVMEALWAKARAGTQVIYIPGNHDEAMREFTGSRFGLFQIRAEVIHTTADNKHLWVTHGDAVDALVRHNILVSHLGDGAYDLIQSINRGLNQLRRIVGFPYWSLSGYLKQRVGKAVRHIAHFETVLAREAAYRGLDGVICGHIHKPAFGVREGVLYANTGDWVENCTALAEYSDGRLSLLQWDIDHQHALLLTQND